MDESFILQLLKNFKIPILILPGDFFKEKTDLEKAIAERMGLMDSKIDMLMSRPNIVPSPR